MTADKSDKIIGSEAHDRVCGEASVDIRLWASARIWRKAEDLIRLVANKRTTQ